MSVPNGKKTPFTARTIWLKAPCAAVQPAMIASRLYSKLNHAESTFGTSAAGYSVRNGCRRTTSRHPPGAGRHQGPRRGRRHSSNSRAISPAVAGRPAGSGSRHRRSTSPSRGRRPPTSPHGRRPPGPAALDQGFERRRPGVGQAPRPERPLARPATPTASPPGRRRRPGRPGSPASRECAGLNASRCSGAMYGRLPPKNAAGPAPSSFEQQPKLKSANSGSPSAVRSTFAGLMSRCRTPCRWA